MVGEGQLVINSGLVQPHDHPHALLAEHGDVGDRGAVGVRVQRAAEGEDLAGDDPIPVAILEALVELIRCHVEAVQR